jgi:hypothetical protein
MEVESKPAIVESFLEYKAFLQEPAIGAWVLPNPFVVALLPIVRLHGSDLTDFGFSTDAKSVGEHYLQVKIRTLGVVLKIFVGYVEVAVTNPDWSMAPKLVPLLDEISGAVQRVAGTSITNHQFTLAFHITHGSTDAELRIRNLVNQELLGPASSYGISVNNADGFFAIEKSVRYEEASFIRVNKKLAGAKTFSEVASHLYEEEVRVLSLIGVEGVV